jgi:signal transduction histidine kinase
MRRSSRAGTTPSKTRRRKPAAPRPRARSKVMQPRSPKGRSPAKQIAQLTGELEEALQLQAATSDVLQAISRSQGDLQPVFDAMLGNARRICDAGFGNVYRWDGEALHLIASHNTPQAFAQYRGRLPLRPSLASPVGRMVATRKVTHIADAANDPGYTEHRDPSLVAAVELGGVRTYLAVPILKENELVGAFTVYRQEVRPFTARQIALITSFASQAVIAIENARLFGELRQRSEERARSVNELRALGEVSQAVNSTLDLKTVLSTIVAKAVQLSDTEAGAIYVFDDARREFHLRATFGMDQELIDALTRRPVSLDEPSVALALAQGSPIEVADLRQASSTDHGDITLRFGYRARLVAPLVRGNAVVGMLVVRRRAPGGFAPNFVELIKTFAAQSALAIHNARLFESGETRSRELARSLDLLQRERSNKLMNLEAMAASIGHEVRQPLGAIASNAGAALRFLARTPPDLEEVRLALERMVRDSRRASEVFDNIRALFGKTAREQEPIDVNELASGVLQAMREDLADRNITTHVELTSQLPPVMGHRGQLQEVFINLVHNAIEAMDAVKDDRRVLQVRTQNHGADAVLVEVEDSGPGINPKQLGSIFDAFVTTKSHGMGLGLAICRMIVERHAGELSASPAHPHGSIFHVVLPAGPAGVE